MYKQFDHSSHSPDDAMSVCHLSSANRTLDSRIFHLQACPTASTGSSVQFIAPHGQNATLEGVALSHFGAPRNRLARMCGAACILTQALRTRADVFQLHDPELLPVGILLKLLGKRVIYDACEDFAAMMATKQYLPRALRAGATKLMLGLENLAAERFDGLITADPWTLARFGRIGKSHKLVFYNFPNLALFPQPGGAPRRFDFVYRGGLSERAGTTVLLQSIRLLADQGRSPKVLIFGYADNPRTRESFSTSIRQLGLSDLIELRGTVPHHEMAQTLAQARIGLSPLLQIPKFERNIPVKVWEYWACGLAVIASDLRPIRPFLRPGTAGLLVKPGDPAALAGAMAQLLDDPALTANMGRRGRGMVADRLHNGREMHKLIRFYHDILRGAA